MSIDFNPTVPELTISLPVIALAEQKTLAVTEINKLAGAKILTLYPQYRQANLTARAVELQSLGEVGSPEWLVIQAIWEWIKSIRTASNTANNAVNLATDSIGIQGVIAGFKAELIAL